MPSQTITFTTSTDTFWSGTSISNWAFTYGGTGGASIRATIPKSFSPIPSADGYKVNSAGDKYAVDMNGEYHRENAPAIIKVNGDEQWWFHGRIHRIGGPALINKSGEIHWYQNHLRHREDGPASEYIGGHKQWWLYGRHLAVNSQDEFQRYLHADKYL